MGETLRLHERLDALREEHHIKSVDACCWCGDGECDGLGCIAMLDTDDATGEDQEALEDLHQMLRQGQAWRVLDAAIEEGEELDVAFALADEMLANADNRAITEDCDNCGQPFGAVGPCDTTCTACRFAPTEQAPS